VVRDFTIVPHELLAQPLIIAEFRKEHERLLTALKQHRGTPVISAPAA
jgi:hypothetical protein